MFLSGRQLLLLGNGSQVGYIALKAKLALTSSIAESTSANSGLGKPNIFAQLQFSSQFAYTFFRIYNIGMNLGERLRVAVSPKKYVIEHFCHGEHAAITLPNETETICQIYQQSQDNLRRRGLEERPARLLIEDGLLAFPIFNTLDVCPSCQLGPTVQPTSHPRERIDKSSSFCSKIVPAAELNWTVRVLPGELNLETLI